MRGQRRKSGVATRNIDVVEQDPYPHPALGGRQQPRSQIAPGGIRIPDVVLGIDGVDGRIDQGIAFIEGGTARIHQQYARGTGMRRGGRTDGPAERGARIDRRCACWQTGLQRDENQQLAEHVPDWSPRRKSACPSAAKMV
jgi:hypothetical protein